MRILRSRLSKEPEGSFPLPLQEERDGAFPRTPTQEQQQQEQQIEAEEERQAESRSSPTASARRRRKRQHRSSPIAAKIGNFTSSLMKKRRLLSFSSSPLSPDLTKSASLGGGSGTQVSSSSPSADDHDCSYSNQLLEDEVPLMDFADQHQQGRYY